MKMTIQKQTTETAHTEIPHEIFVRFLKSLGYPVTKDSKVKIWQEGYISGDKPGKPVQVTWEHDRGESIKEVEVIDEDTVNILAGLQDA